MNSVALLSLQILIQGENTKKSKEDPSCTEEMPDIVTIKEVEKDAFNIHISVGKLK